MDPSTLTKILIDFQHHNPEIQKPAEQRLIELSQDLPNYLTALCTQLASPDVPVNAKLVALVNIKRHTYSHDAQARAKLNQQWLALNPSLRDDIKKLILSHMETNEQQIRNLASDIVAGIAIAEIPVQQWTGIVDILVTAVLNPEVAPFLKQSSLSVLGDICAKLDDEGLIAKSNNILNAIGTATSLPEPATKLAAVRCLTTCLKFCEKNFENQAERDLILQMVQSLLVNTTDEVMEAGWECLGEIADLYLELLPNYMQGIFELSKNTIAKCSEKVAMMAIEFWTVVATREIAIADHIAICADEGVDPGVVLHNFAKHASKELVPILVHALTQQEEDADDDTWNVATAAGLCLTNLAECTGSSIFADVLPHLRFDNPDWRQRDAHITAFGCVLCAGDLSSITPQIVSVFPQLLGFLKDPQPHIRESTAWVLSELCMHASSMFVLHPQLLLTFMQQALESLQDRPRVIINICLALLNLASALDDESANILTPYIEGLTRALLTITEQNNEATVLIHAYEALSELVKVAPSSLHDTIIALLPILGTRLHTTLSSTQGNLQQLGHTHGLICCAVESILTNAMLKEDLTPQLVTDLFGSFMAVIKADSGADDEAILCINALIKLLGADCEAYMATIFPLLIERAASSSVSTARISMTAISEASYALGKALNNYSDAIVGQLLTVINNPEVDRTVKPAAIECLGDIACNIDNLFERYLPHTMNVCAAASVHSITSKHPNADVDTIEYLQSLQSSIISAYSCIFIAFQSSGALKALANYMTPLVEYLGEIAQDPELTSDILSSALVFGLDIVRSASDVDPSFPKFLAGLAQIPKLFERGLKHRKQAIQKSATKLKNAFMQLQ